MEPRPLDSKVLAVQSCLGYGVLLEWGQDAVEMAGQLFRTCKLMPGLKKSLPRYFVGLSPALSDRKSVV